MKQFFIPMLSLQVFAEGAAAAGTGDGGTAEGTGVTAPAAGVQQKGAKNPLAGVKYGIQEGTPSAGVTEPTAQKETEPDPNQAFEALIKGQYKQQFEARVQDILGKRLKGSKETADRMAAVTPVLEMLAQKYGVDATDITALGKAIEEDDSFWEEEADRMGLSVKQLKSMRAMERENTQLRQQMEQQKQQEGANRLYAQWMEQAEATRQVYPNMDLKTEMSNPRFVELLRSNIDVRTAYEVIHRDEIIPAAMQFAAQTIEAKMAKSIASGRNRPSENGMGAQSAVVVKSDVSQLTKADREEIRRRVARGEKIRF